MSKPKGSKKKGVYAGKVKRATHMLFYRRHQKPGVKGWELHKALGSDYPKVLEIVDDYLKSLDLQVKTVFEEEKPIADKPSIQELDKARFYVTLRGELTPKEPKMIGWRIDDLAGLAITISYIISKKGQAQRKDVEQLLSEKIPDWKIGPNIDRYIRYGYLCQDENGLLYLDWRTSAEVDQKTLVDALLRGEMQNEESVELAEEQEKTEDEDKENEVAEEQEE